MSPESSLLNGIRDARANRRAFLRRMGLAGVAGALAPSVASMLAPSTASAAPEPSAALDVSILNFALNLEYLEAQYYTYATLGTSIAEQGIGTDGGDGTASGGVITKDGDKRVRFTDSTVADFAAEIAEDERNHVKFLRTALAAAGNKQAAQPEIDLNNSFNALANVLGIGSFDPFASQTNFLLGAFIFEDVGVSAYRGASPLIYDRGYIAPAAGILAVEAFHAGAIRTLLYNLSQSEQDGANIISTVQKISDLRDTADSPNKDKDQGISTNGTANIAATDANGIAFGRSTSQVLRIVYGMQKTGGKAPSPGGFFPNGLSGDIK